MSVSADARSRGTVIAYSVATFTGEPVSLAHFRDERLRAWADGAIERAGIRKSVIFSSPMAQYDVHPGD